MSAGVAPSVLTRASRIPRLCIDVPLRTRPYVRYLWLSDHGDPGPGGETHKCVECEKAEKAEKVTVKKGASMPSCTSRGKTKVQWVKA